MIKNLKKEQLFILVLMAILLLVIMIPVPEEREETEKRTTETLVQEDKTETEEKLKKVLEKISGVGKVEIYISYGDRGKFVVEKDEIVSEEQIEETDSSGGTRKTTMIQNERQTIYDQNETPYIIQELSPTIEGILVVAEGAGNAEVKKQIESTLEALFGLEAHKISIMKMEVSK